MIRHASAKQPVPPSLIWLTIAIASSLLLGFLLLGLVQTQSDRPDASSPGGPTSTSPVSKPSPTRSEPEPERTEASFTVLAGGDVLPHVPVHASARTGSGYDFGPLLAGVDPWVQGADLALCHLEVPFAPLGQKVSGYPMFAASADLAEAIAAQGWAGCSTASNHSVDRKFAGVVRTLDVFDEVGLGHVGTARTELEARQPARYTITVDGIDTVVAHLSATYGTNGLPIPTDQPWAVQLIDTDQLIQQAHAARESGADLVLVSIHAGNEYQTRPTDEQLRVASALAESGEVDLMIGHHAHVPQPMVKLDGGPSDEGMWVAYGLGNMISNQDSDCCIANTDSGLLLTADVRHIAGEPARVTSMHWAGITVDRLGGHRVYALADLLRFNNGIGTLSAEEIQARYERVKEAVGPQIPEQVSPPPSQDSAVTVDQRATSFQASSSEGASSS